MDGTEPLATPAVPSGVEERPLLFDAPLVEIGRGVQARVCATTWQGRRVAVKVFALRDLGRRDVRRARDAYERELRLLRLLDHDNVVRCFGGHATEDELFLILELCSGPLWPVRVAAGVLPVFPTAMWLHAIQDVARGMAHMAERGVLHRDLMVQNLLFTQVGDRITTKIGDFGVAQFVSDIDNVIRGSCRHYPPECLGRVNEEPFTELADVFMFAYVIHDLQHGRHTWSREESSAAVAQTLAGERPPLLVPCDPQLEAIKQSCWSQRANDRPRFSDIEEQLQRITCT
jgi:serine/threonine protein kinase